jgi:uncharacterized protein YkwD
MHKGHIFRKDGFLTVTIVGLFCCLFLIVGLKQGEAIDSKAVINNTPVENNASVIIATNQIHNNKTQSLAIPSTSTIDTLQNTMVDDTQPKKENVKQDVATKKPNITKKKTLVVSSIKPVFDEEKDALYTKEVTRLIEEKTNAFRVSESLLPLSYDIRLAANAKMYSRVMQDGDFLSHTNTNGCGLTCRFTKDGYKATAWGENLATMSFSSRPSADELASFFMTEWKKSAGHRENLMSEVFTNQGIGIAVSKSSIYATVHFSKP